MRREGTAVLGAEGHQKKICSFFSPFSAVTAPTPGVMRYMYCTVGQMSFLRSVFLTSRFAPGTNPSETAPFIRTKNPSECSLFLASVRALALTSCQLPLTMHALLPQLGVSPSCAQPLTCVERGQRTRK